MTDDEPAAASDRGPRHPIPNRRIVRVVAATFGLAAIVAVGAWMLRPADPAATASPSTAPAPVVSPSVTPSPTPTGYPSNTVAYDVGDLPEVSVFSVIPALEVDDEPQARTTGETARPLTAAPVWADPTGEPVAYLPRDLEFDGTTVPIVERQENWVKVLLIGRQSVPSQGDPSQVSGWMRTHDVEIAESDVSVSVSIGARTVDIVRGGAATRIADDFGWGTEVTPTPVGRAYIMTTRVVPEYWYTRGHPIVYLSVQSPTLDGFGGASVAVTAFHYHDQRSGPVSNGCIRLGSEAIQALAELPYGTAVSIAP